MNPINSAYGVRVGGRWFARWQANGVAGTAWSLAGAKLFLSREDAINATAISGRRRLPRRGFQIVTVSLGSVTFDQVLSQFPARCGFNQK